MWKKGFVGVAKFSAGLLSVVILVNLFVLFSIPVFSTNSTSVYFNVTSTVSFNWTAGNITMKVIDSDAGNITLVIVNSSTFIYANYSQDDNLYRANDVGTYGFSTYGNLTSANWNLCFNTTPSGVKNMKFIVQIQNLSYTNITKALNISSSDNNRTYAYLTPHLVCPPGRYYGNFSVRNATNSSEYANVTATIDIPISTDNTLNETTYIAFFRGKIGANSYYHSYYFNTSEIANVTAVTINLSGYSQDVDLFLFYGNGTLISQSVNRSSGYEQIATVYLPYSEMWEIRVYGNTTSTQGYDGYLHYTTLNITTNASGNAVAVRSLDFGTINPNGTNSTLNFTIRNEDDHDITNVNRRAEIYHVKKWTNGTSGYNTNSNFTEFLVPMFAQKIKVKIEWLEKAGTNSTNWTLYLRDVNDTLVDMSTSKYVNANQTNGIMEEYVEYSGPFNTTDKYGYWGISVYNDTNGSLDPYNVTAYIWVNESAWFNSNYTNGFDFNSSGSLNSTYNISVNITVPENDILNGSYEGFFEYSNSSGWKLRLPISFNVRAGMLIINNSMETTTFRKGENIGFERTAASNPVTMNITFNNTGGYPIYYVNTTSDFALYYTGDSSYYMNFTVDNWPSNPINDSSSGNSSGTINITVTVNTSRTNNQVGTYRGWILFNTTNSSNMTRQSAPYEVFNLTLEVNLTNKLIVDVTKLEPVGLNVSNTSKNVTITVQVRLANESGNVISLPNTMFLKNFTDVWINETNITSYSVHNSSVLKAAGGTLCDGNCYINATIPNATVGGRYNLSIKVVWTTPDGTVLTGTGANTSFIINDTGLNASAISSRAVGTFNEFTYRYFNASVKNFGPKAATSAKVTFNTGACSVTVAQSSYSCSGGGSVSSYSSGAYTFTMPGYDDSGCWFRWKLTGSNVSANTSCNDASVTVDMMGFNNVTGISMAIAHVPQSTTTPPGGTTTTTYTYTHTISITNYEPVIYATLGGSNSTFVVVKHAGNVSSMTIKVNVTGLSGVDATVSPSSYDVSSGNSVVFSVVLNVSNTTTLGNQTGTFKAYEPGTNYYDSESFTLVILSTPEREVEINISYENYTTQFDNLSAEFERIRATGFVSAANLTRVGALVNETNDTINDIQAAIDGGDYATAESLLAGLAAQLDRLRTELSAIQREEVVGEEGFWSSVWVWVIVGIIVAGAASLLIYMLLPAGEGYHIGRGYKPRGEGLWKRIKDKLKRKKKGGVKKGVGPPPKPRGREEKPAEYAEGYERQRGYNYRYSTKGKAIKESVNGVKNLLQRNPKRGFYDYTPAEKDI